MDSDRSLHPRLAIVDRYIYAVWQTEKIHEYPFSSLRDEIKFRYSDDNGKSFSNVMKISNRSILDPIEPNIAAVGDNVYIVWAGLNKDHFFNIFFTSSEDRGKSFSNIVNLQNDLTHHMVPEIAGKNRTVYVTWQNGGTLDNQSFMISDDNGRTFKKNVTFRTEPTSIMNPKMVVTDGEVVLAWDVEPRIYLALASR